MKPALKSIAALAAVAALSACGAAAGDPENTSVTIAQGVDASTMDPALHTQVTTSSVLLSIYDPLVIRGTDGTLLPGLATEWESTDDTHWKFSLRQGVTFSNGEAFAADDVVYSLQRVQDKATKSPTASNLSTIATVTAPDDQTVVIETVKPDPLLPTRMTQTSLSTLILPKDYLEANGKAVPENKPVGTGPYTLDEWAKDDHITLSSRADYWGEQEFWKEGSKPSKITIKPVPEAAGRMAALKNGEADLITNVPPELASTLTGNVSAKQSDADTVYYFGINADLVPAFADQRVRQALNYAVDKDALVKNVLSGAAKPIAVTLSQSGFGYPKDKNPYPYDPEKAKSLLAEAGYPGGQGIGPVQLMSRTGRFTKDTEVVQAVAGYLKAIGLDASVNFVETGVWGDLGDQHKRGPLHFTGWNNAADPALAWYPLLRSGSFQSYFSDPALDALMDQGQTTLDGAKRKEIYAKAADQIYEKAPHLFLYQGAAIYGLSERTKFVPNTDEQLNVRNLTVAK